jgi:hypothetical protein
MNEGIYESGMRKDEKFVRFESMQSYVVPAGKRHQIVHNKTKNDIGIAISPNGRKDFRKHDKETVYFYTGPYAYKTTKPISSYGITVDLSRLV